MARSIKWNNAEEWQIESSDAVSSRRSVRGPQASDPPIPPDFLAPGVSVEKVMDATAVPGRAAGAPMIDLSVTPAPGESYAIAIRHASGALTFHGPEVEIEQRGRGRRAAQAATLRFRVPLRGTPGGGERRGIVSKAVKVILLKVTTKVVDALLPVLATKVESALWKKAGRSEGWFKVDEPSLKSGELRPGAPTEAGPSGRALIFLHGTFSHAASAFKNLADTGFFAQVQPLYGDQIFAFNHFTVSKTPEQNAEDFLAGLPDRELICDVVTHSRGGLVLRNLVERAGALGATANRFKLHHAVLVASPNDGTPLATPDRWKNTVGWFANLLEVFPDNPLTFAAGFVAESIVWIAQRAGGSLPGLASMDGAGDMIAELQGPPGPPASGYSALVSNFQLSDDLFKRMLDVGIDTFFGSANDLVVPSEGGWQIDREVAPPAIPPERIGCFGPGGNFPPSLPPVHHLNFFGRMETAGFLARALKGEAQALAAIDPAKALPSNRLQRGAAAAAIGARRERPAEPTAPPAPAAEPRPLPMGPDLSPVYSDALQLTLLAPQSKAGEPGEYQLLATYGGARIVEPYSARGGEAGQRWFKIIQMHERMKKYVDGELGFETPTEEELIEYGKVLFETLLPREARRLYDVARSRERSGHLNVIFTSMVPWIADKPWEFAFDPDRKTFLATQELHFVRNALTAMPAESITPKAGPLRILVAVAQPIGTGRLSSEQEEAVIRRGFQPLTEAGLVEIDVLRSTTPTLLHRWVSARSYDVVHFIGHGAFDADTQKGYLLFEDDKGAVFNVEARNACEILCQRGIRLIFLNACETGRGDARGSASHKADFNRGIAPALVAYGVPAVVANQFSVRDQAATEFAQHFYWALAQGASFGSAAREARIAVNYSTSRDTIDWAIPVVYARDPESRLCRPRELTLEMIKTPLVPASARRATAAHTMRVAVWDMNHMLPDLETTVRQMNAVQERFGFEVVDISVPMGSWQDYKGKGLQLHANVAADGLKNKRQELGVDFIFCITDKPIMFKNGNELHWNYYCWWSHRGEENIVIFSVAFPDLPTRGPAADRAIANGVVQGLTGILADTGTHGRGPKTCPLYLNNERNLKLVISRQTFDDKCEKSLRKEIPADLPALEALLAAFD